MNNLRLSMTFLLLLFGMPLLAGCGVVGGVALGLGATAGGMAMEERGFDQSVIDKKIGLDINSALSDKDSKRFKEVYVNVVEGVVLITGQVENRQDRVSVMEATWATEGVEKVHNELIIAEDGIKTDFSSDLTIKSKLGTAITFDEDILALNYGSSVVNGTVYLYGIAQNQAELDKVIAHAKSLSYVRRVLSFVRMKDDPERMEWLARQPQNAAQ